MDEMKSRLLEIIREKSLKKGEVTLASGRKSNFYIDCREVTLSPEGAYLTGRLFLDMIRTFGRDVEAVGGPTLGADPIVTSIALESYRDGTPLPAFIVRKEPKGYGMNSWIEGRGNIRKGANVAILEDVVTTGESALKAAKRAEEEGLKVVLILAIIDREEGGADRIREAGYEFRAIFSKREILSL